MPYGNPRGYSRGSSRSSASRSNGNGNGRGRSSSSSRFAPPSGRGGGHWFDGRWYPSSAAQSGPSSRTSPGRSRRYSPNGNRDSMGREPRDYYEAEGDFDPGEGDFGASRRIGFRF